MNDSVAAFLRKALPPAARLRFGFLIACLLWLLFLVVTAYTSAATLLDRVGSTDVMKAASGGAWTGTIAWQVAAFVAVQLLLHLAFAVLTWILAVAAALRSDLARQKFGRIVVGWFCVLAAGVIAYSGYWFPRTLIGAYYHDALSQHVGPLVLGPFIYWAALAACVAVLARGALPLWRHASVRARRIGAFSALALAGVAVLSSGWSAIAPEPRRTAARERPHVILLGIDSLRLEQLRRFGGTGVTPNLDRFLGPADLFRDATTPAARTFSSWVAILSGRAPTVTGARFNLAERSGVRANPTLADVLRQAGYHTVYSTDEVRFANIDYTFGFDQVVTPRIGASDFLIGTYNDLPLASLFINHRAGKWLFPFSHANRGVATMFQPDSFLGRLEREVEFERPTLLISHLTAAHWPYYTADVPFDLPKPTPDNPKPGYRIGLQTADRMFGELVALLERKGALENAIVILLSDHGEAFGLPSDSFFDAQFRVDGLRAPLKMLDFGHGQSVLSQSQYRVLLGLQAFGSGLGFESAGRDFMAPVTVEDIAPTVLDILGIGGDPLRATGVTLLPFLARGQTEVSAGPARIRFTETDLSVLPAPDGGVDEVATARQNSKFFEVDPHSGRLHIRPLFEPLAIAFKERAAFTNTHLLAAMPAGPYAHQFIFLDFAEHRGQLLLERPRAPQSAEAQRLWDALHEHYGAELMPPTVITPQDWPRIEAEWQSFLTNRPAVTGPVK